MCDFRARQLGPYHTYQYLGHSARGEGETCVVAVGKLCLAGRGSTQVFTFFEQLLACSSVDRTVDAASAEE